MNDMIIQIEDLGSVRLNDCPEVADFEGRNALLVVLTLRQPLGQDMLEDGGIGFTLMAPSVNKEGFHQVYEDQYPLPVRLLYALIQVQRQFVTIRRLTFDVLDEVRVLVMIEYRRGIEIAEPDVALCRVAQAINNAYKQYPLLTGEEQKVELWKNP